MINNTLYQIVQGNYQTYRETLEDALDWSRYRAYELGEDVHITSTDGEVNWTIARNALSFRILWDDGETTMPTREQALVEAHRLAQQIPREVMVYDYNEKRLAKFAQRGNVLFEEFYPSDRIAISRDVCMGSPRIAGTRIPVWVILDLLADGWDTEEIIEDYDDDNITTLDVMACLDYASKALRGLTFVSPPSI